MDSQIDRKTLNLAIKLQVEGETDFTSLNSNDLEEIVREEYLLKATQLLQARQERCNKLAMGGAIVALAIGLWGIVTYNSLINQQIQVEQAWAQVENVYQRKFDLLPALTQVTERASDRHMALIVEMSELRSQATLATSQDREIAIFIAYDAALERLLAVETLSTVPLFENLQVEIAGTENRIAVERRRYNQSVGKYNQNLRQFPTNLAASMMGFEAPSLFQVNGSNGIGLPIVSQP